MVTARCLPPLRKWVHVLTPLSLASLPLFFFVTLRHFPQMYAWDESSFQGYLGGVLLMGILTAAALSIAASTVLLVQDFRKILRTNTIPAVDLALDLYPLTLLLVLFFV